MIPNDQEGLERLLRAYNHFSSLLPTTLLTLQGALERLSRVDLEHQEDWRECCRKVYKPLQRAIELDQRVREHPDIREALYLHSCGLSPPLPKSQK